MSSDVEAGNIMDCNSSSLMEDGATVSDDMEWDVSSPVQVKIEVVND